LLPKHKTNLTGFKRSDFRVADYYDASLLGINTVEICKLIPTFQWNVLLSSSMMRNRDFKSVIFQNSHWTQS